MSRSRILLAIFVGLPVTVLLTLNASVAESVSDECRARPGSSAAPGTYWRYRVSRPDHRRCWFLSFERVKIRSHTRAAVSDSATSNATSERDSSLEAAGTNPPRPASAATVSLQEAIAEAAPAETALAGRSVDQSVGEDETRFSARWPDSSNFRDFDVREFPALTSSYADRYSAANADEQAPLVWPVTGAQRSRLPLDVAGDTGWRAVFDVSTLAVALLAIASGAFLALPFRQSHPRDPRRIAVDELPAHRNMDVVSVDRSSGARARPDQRVLRSVTPTDPARDLKKSLAELMGDLRRARTAPHAPRSFAPSKLGGSYQRGQSTRDLLPPIDGWGQANVVAAGFAEKAPNRNAPAGAHELFSDLPQTTLTTGPSLVPA
jgi:hypothetical protein